MMKFIVAGNYVQANMYRLDSQIPKKEFRVVDHPEQLYGLRGKENELIQVGTYYERKDYSEIWHIAKRQDFKITKA